MSASVYVPSFLTVFSQLIVYFFWIFVLANTVTKIDGLKLTNMSAPILVDFKETINLDCRFDMEGEDLYAVKWYKDDHEFFRYMPHQKPMYFNVDGVSIVNEETTCNPSRCKVHLNKLVRNRSSGAYRCEVSTEAPAFRLASETHNITVAALPKGGPTIDLDEGVHHPTDVVTATCHSPSADPVPSLSWFINKEQAPDSYIRELKSIKRDQEGLLSASSILSFRLDPKKLHDKSLQLTCISKFLGNNPSSTTKTVSVKSGGQETANQMLHTWHYSSSWQRRCDILLLIFLAVVRWHIGH